MLMKIELADGTIFNADTVREMITRESHSNNVMLIITVDSSEKLEGIDYFKSIFTPQNLATITATSLRDNGYSATFEGYTVVNNIDFSLNPNSYHYDFSFRKPAASNTSESVNA